MTEFHDARSHGRRRRTVRTVPLALIWAAAGLTMAGPAAAASATPAVTAGYGHTCAVRADGTLWCWGSNGSGQLGTDNNTNTTIPVRVGTADRVGPAISSTASTSVPLKAWRTTARPEGPG